jgi:hypothetical protein
VARIERRETGEKTPKPLVKYDSQLQVIKISHSSVVAVKDLQQKAAEHKAAKSGLMQQDAALPPASLLE